MLFKHLNYHTHWLECSAPPEDYLKSTPVKKLAVVHPSCARELAVPWGGVVSVCWPVSEPVPKPHLTTGSFRLYSHYCVNWLLWEIVSQIKLEVENILRITEYVIRIWSRNDKDFISQQGCAEQKLFSRAVPHGKKWLGPYTLSHCVGPSHEECDLGSRNKADTKELTAWVHQLTLFIQVPSWRGIWSCQSLCISVPI